MPTCTKKGTTGNDKLVGTANRDILCGGGGNDVVLIGKSGNDSLQGGLQNDILNGGTGTDTPSYASSTTPVTASLATDFATGEGSDLLSFLERLTGSACNDRVDGGTGNDTCQTDTGDKKLNCPQNKKPPARTGS